MWWFHTCAQIFVDICGLGRKSRGGQKIMYVAWLGVFSYIYTYICINIYVCDVYTYIYIHIYVYSFLMTPRAFNLGGRGWVGWCVCVFVCACVCVGGWGGDEC